MQPEIDSFKSQQTPTLSSSATPAGRDELAAFFVGFLTEEPD